MALGAGPIFAGLVVEDPLGGLRQPGGLEGVLWRVGDARLSLNHGEGRVLLGQGARMEPVLAWLQRRGARSARAVLARVQD